MPLRGTLPLRRAPHPCPRRRSPATNLRPQGDSLIVSMTTKKKTAKTRTPRDPLAGPRRLRDEAIAEGLRTPTFERLIQASLIRAAYLDAWADRQESPRHQLDGYAAGTRALGEAIKGLRHAAKDRYLQILAALEARQQQRGVFEVAYQEALSSPETEA